MWNALLFTNDPNLSSDHPVNMIFKFSQHSQETVYVSSKLKNLWNTQGPLTPIRNRVNMKTRLLKTLKEKEYKNCRNTLTNIFKSTKYEYYKIKIDDAGR